MPFWVLFLQPFARMCFLLSQCTILPIRSDVAYILRSRMIFRPSSVRFLFARNRFIHFWDFSFCFFKSSEIQVIWDSNNVNEILVGYQNYERFDVCGFFRNSKYWVSDNVSRAIWILVVSLLLSLTHFISKHVAPTHHKHSTCSST